MTPEEFKAALARLGWSQAAAARELGIASRNQVNKFANGRRRVPDYIATNLVRALELADLREQTQPVGASEQL